MAPAALRTATALQQQCRRRLQRLTAHAQASRGRASIALPVEWLPPPSAAAAAVPRDLPWASPVRGPVEEAAPRAEEAARGAAAEGQAAEQRAADERTQLVLRISQLVEDDPALAKEFGRSLALNAAALRAAEALCVRGEASEICPPTAEQLKQVGMASALPFLGFGILDNAVMIIFGDVIDATLCTSLGFSTMAAAALGNTLSDGMGVFSGGMVEDMATKAGFEAPPLSRAQQAMGSTKRWERYGQLVGITIGCLIGMFPLAFINPSDTEANKREKMLEGMYEHVVVAVEDMLDAEAAMIVLVDDERRELYSRSAAHHGSEVFEFRAPVGEGIIGRVAETGHFLNIADVRAPEGREYYSADIHDNFRGTGIRVRSVLCMPVLGYNSATERCDKVVGVVCVINKNGGSPFAERDEDALAALCSHISTSLSFVHGQEHGFDETLDRCARALRTKGTRINSAQNQRVHDLYVSVLQGLSSRMGVETAELIAIDPDKQDAQVLASSSKLFQNSGSFASEGGQPTDMTAVSRVLASGQTCVAEDPFSTLLGDGVPVATLCCPIFSAKGRIIGAVQVSGNARDKSFSGQDKQLLKRAAGELSAPMEGIGASLTKLLGDLAEE